MAITGKQSVEEEELELDFVQEVYQIVRWIIKGTMSNPDANEWSVFDINAYINKICREQGFELQNEHYLGETPTAYGMLYILVRWVEKK